MVSSRKQAEVLTVLQRGGTLEASGQSRRARYMRSDPTDRNKCPEQADPDRKPPGVCQRPGRGW